MTEPFAFINAINYSKEDLIVDEQSEKEYVPFLANRSLSYFPDAILYANEINMNHHLDNKLQFDYLLNSIRQRKRYGKWHKTVPDEKVNLLMEYFKCNKIRAVEAAKILTDAQVEQIQEIMQGQ